MRIYTVTYLINNYGSILQAYALQCRLKEFGGEPVIIYKKATQSNSFLHTLKRVLTPQKHYSLIQRIKKEQQKKKFEKKNEKIAGFISKNLSTKEITKIDDFVKGVDANDVFLAGSDQIWNVLNSSLSKWYSLQWVQSGNKYSYAASIGLDKLTEEQRQMYRTGLSEFQMISLRESQAVSLLSPSFENKVRQDLDPTLLYDGNFWRQFASRRKEEEPYVFVYMLRPDKGVIELAKRVAEERKCKIIYTGLYTDRIKGVTTICDAGVEDFLSYIDFADAVVTNSFHGTVFSVLFKKPFLSVKLETTSSRVESFLEMTGLGTRLVKAPFISATIPDADYVKADNVLARERMKSLDYLASICNRNGMESE